jgi:hypothetical protein
MVMRPSESMMDTTNETMSFEIVVIYGEEKDPQGTFKSLLDREFEEIDEDVYLLEDFTIRKNAKADSTEVLEAIKNVNACYEYRLCPCNKYVIKDAHAMCFYCHMTAVNSDMNLETCTICHEETHKIAMRPQPCCKQYMHTRCINTWNNLNPNCPICRGIPDKIISEERDLC